MRPAIKVLMLYAFGIIQALSTNKSVLSGAIDIIVIESNGVLRSMPFHARLGIFQTVNTSRALVNLLVNGVVTPVSMSLTDEGDVYFPGNTDKFTPTEQQLASLNLKKGKNAITFQMTNGQSLCTSIYLWESTVKIVISDIDGTITKSDALGMFLPLIGFDWSQMNVVKLYSDIQRNGYNIVYLTSRAIGESQTTKNYITHLKQDGLSLPDGPILLSPDDLVKSLLREVWYRQPQTFKIACLQSIKALFPDTVQPLYAGFGNRDTDALSYSTLNVLNERIFIINPEGEVHRISGGETSYALLDQNVDTIFPNVK